MVDVRSWLPTNVWLYLGADGVSTWGTGIALVAIPFAVLGQGGTPADISVALAAALIALLAALLYAGVVADRLPRARIMVTANVVQGTAQLVSAAMFGLGGFSIWLLAGLQAIRGAANGFYLPAAAGLLPQIVTTGDLGRVNVLARVVRSAALIVGAGTGGLLVSGFGPAWALLVDAATFFVAAALRFIMRLDGVRPAARRTILTDLRHGWREFAGRRWLWVTVLQLAVVAALLQSALTVIGPVLMTSRYNGAASWGALTMASALGAVAGGLLVFRSVPRRLLLWGCLGVLAVPPYFVALAASPPFGVLLVAALVAGAAAEPLNVCLDTAIQTNVPREALSRVSAYDQLGGYGMAPVGALLAGPAVAVIGLVSTLIVCAVLVTILTLIALGVPEVRQLSQDNIN